MPLAYSKLTAQGQISVPAGVRRKLGLGPGSVIEWEEQSGQIHVRRAGRFTSEDIHRALFAGGVPQARSLDELNEGLRQNVRKRNARR
jgi:antitoxin PrlF